MKDDEKEVWRLLSQVYNDLMGSLESKGDFETKRMVMALNQYWHKFLQLKVNSTFERNDK